ncbi:HAD family hydrolase [Candidatus Kaiserbacteria bacterium]|nr:HAD family hydrolase [Candidatus Kaiserbacteria bacterium]
MDGTLVLHTSEFDCAHDELRYETYAKVVGKLLNDEIRKEFNSLYEQKGTNSAVFVSLGLPSDYWQKHFNTLSEEKFYKPEPKIFGTLERLKDIIPISLFTNAQLSKVRKTFEVVKLNPNWFTHIISGDDIKTPKPSVEGFLLMVERTGIPAQQILYVGDRVKGEIIPARSVGVQTALMWSELPEADYSFKNFEDILTLFPK